MLREASVNDIRSGEIRRRDGYLVICMRHYPRFLRKSLRDEYQISLAPSPELFRDFRVALTSGSSHNSAFRKAQYVKRFGLSEVGLAHLERLSRLARKKDVFLVCECQRGEMCHRILLLRIARKFFGAPVSFSGPADFGLK